VLKRRLKFVFFALLLLWLAAFAVANRTPIELDLFPLPVVLALPVFLLVWLSVVLGVLLAWLVLAGSLFKTKRLATREHKQLLATQNELDSLRAEQQPVSPPPAITGNG
jgi:uncharacterized integral membrane protein